MINLKRIVKDSELYISTNGIKNESLIRLSFTKEVTDGLDMFKKIFNNNKTFVLKADFTRFKGDNNYLLMGYLVVKLNNEKEIIKLSEELKNNKNVYIQEFISYFDKNRSKIKQDRIISIDLEESLENMDFDNNYTKVLFFSKYLKLGKIENIKKIVSEELISQVANQEVKLSNKKDDLIIRALVDKDKARLSEELRNMIEVENGKITDYSRELFELNFKK